MYVHMSTLNHSSRKEMLKSIHTGMYCIIHVLSYVDGILAFSEATLADIEMVP